MAKQEHEAALYSINLAIEIAESNSSSPVKLEYLILRVSALKNLDRYSEALKQLNQLLNNEANRIREKNSQISEQDLCEMKLSIEELIKRNELEKANTTTVEADLNQNEAKTYFSYKLDQRCRIENSPVVGRHFVANDDIPEGSLLLEERPYCMALSPEYMTERCTSCHQPLHYKFFPCWHCTEVVFCDRKCGKFHLCPSF